MSKIERVAFIYLEPKKRDNEEQLAQCSSCRMFMPKLKRCIIHGSDVEIDGDDSCGFWVDWPTPDGKPNPEVVADHSAEIEKGIEGSVTPEESGLVDELVQCHRCKFFDKDKSECHLFWTLNKAAPDLFDLDIKVKPHGCCNAWTKSETRDKRNRIVLSKGMRKK